MRAKGSGVKCASRALRRILDQQRTITLRQCAHTENICGKSKQVCENNSASSGF
jgi:hypothetical protein